MRAQTPRHQGAGVRGDPLLDQDRQRRDLANVLQTLRTVLDDAGCPWAGSHTFRRTVATMLDEAGHGVGAIATLLGQDPVTTMSYIKTKDVGEAAALTFDAAW